MEPNSAANPEITLPFLVVTPADVGRLIHELEIIDEALLQQQLQHQALKLARTSKLMDELVGINRSNLLEAQDRTRLKQALTAIRQQAPVLHISLSADPSPSFLAKLMHWLRTNIHPQVLITIGRQPTIGAGCRLRTTNKYFDFSLSQRFEHNQQLFLDKLHAVIAAAPAQEKT